MATKIRLARFGKKHQPSYRIVVSASRTKRDGKVIETLGFFNPSLLDIPKKEGHESLKIDLPRLNYWLGTGAQPTEAVTQLVNNTYEYKRYYKGKTAGEESENVPEIEPVGVSESETAEPAIVPAETNSSEKSKETVLTDTSAEPNKVEELVASEDTETSDKAVISEVSEVTDTTAESEITEPSDSADTPEV